MAMNAAVISSFQIARDNLLLALENPSSLLLLDAQGGSYPVTLGSSDRSEDALHRFALQLEEIQNFVLDSARKLEAAARNLHLYQRYVRGLISLSRAPVHSRHITVIREVEISATMKLIITGASGYVGTELVRQSLQHLGITFVVAVTRKPIEAPAGVSPEQASKLQNIVIRDYDQYSPEAKEAFVNASACIWTVAITPSKSLTYKWSEVVRVCQTSPLAGLQAMFEAGPSSPFRFLYMSGYKVERDQSKPPPVMARYVLMRGETENRLLAFAKEHPGVEVTVAKPAYIPAPESLLRSFVGGLIKWGGGISISRADIVTAMLDQVVNGFDKDPLDNADLVGIAERVKADLTVHVE
ncbi:hypothetical protein DL93DRAFT_2169194 [Clavulina sp. PMI_390]|nr:hypothetical protein DL93DRAFT_2169194 [Clavulina sp. PMI_390]